MSDPERIGVTHALTKIRVQPYLRAVRARRTSLEAFARRVGHAIDTATVTASDLVGCRYRYPQRLAHPEIPRLPAELERRERLAAARAAVQAALPTRRALGDGRGARPFARIDLADTPGVELETLEALAAGADLITGAVFIGDGWRVRVDVLALTADGTYLPVTVSNHRAARRDEGSTMLAVATNRLSLSAPMAVPYRHRHHVSDGYRLAMASRALAEFGLDSGLGGVIGQDRTRAFVAETAGLQPALDDALRAGWADQPRRLKECASCRFWELCEPELETMDDISLVLPGDKARTYRERGITTVQELIDARLGEPSALAAAWRAGVPLLARVPEVTGPRADVEIDVDMEAYLDQGAYLWGAYDGRDYRGFATWAPLGGAEEAANFAEFWSWLMQRRRAAHQSGQSFAAYCYSAHGENHWLRQSARRFHGKHRGVPSEAEVQEFITSGDWVDVFAHVRSQLAGTEGTGLKIVAREAGYAWADGDFDGEASVGARRTAVATGPEALAAREALLRYNEDDTRATAAVRGWLRDGAPGVQPIS